MTKDKIFILDETKGKSPKGKAIKWVAERYGIPYYTDADELIKYLKEETDEN